MEVITAGAETLEVTPAILYQNSEPNAAGELYMSVTNLETTATAITVSVDVVPIEGRGAYLSEFHELLDVDTTGVVDGDGIVYDAAASKWVPGASSSSGSSFSGSYNDLTDKPTLFSGSYNDLTDTPAPSANSLDDLTDVNYANGSLDITGLDEMLLTSSDTPTGVTRKIFTNPTYGVGLVSHDDSAELTGSHIYVHETKGVECRTHEVVVIGEVAEM